MKFELKNISLSLLNDLNAYSIEVLDRNSLIACKKGSNYLECLKNMAVINNDKFQATPEEMKQILGDSTIKNKWILWFDNTFRDAYFIITYNGMKDWTFNECYQDDVGTGPLYLMINVLREMLNHLRLTKTHL